MRSLLPFRFVIAYFLLLNVFADGTGNGDERHFSACPNGPFRDLPDMRAPSATDELRSAKSKKENEASGNGGLIFFLHIPKTGGTSIRRNFEHLDHVEYTFGRNYSVYWEEASKVEDLILGKSLMQQNQNRKHRNRLRTVAQDDDPKKKVLFFEIHASTSPSFYRLRQRLHRWRLVARRNKVPVFFFTVMRDPMAFAISHFNYFHVDVRNPTFEHVNATEENFLRLSLHNPQCQFLFKGEASMRNQLKKSKEGKTSLADSTDGDNFNTSAIVTQEECNKVQDQMEDLLDWIGTTETLSNETLPLLAQILGVPPNFNFAKHRVSERVKKVTVDLWGMENLTESGLEAIRERSQLDLGMYHRAQTHYPYCMWRKDPHWSQRQKSEEENESDEEFEEL